MSHSIKRHIAHFGAIISNYSIIGFAIILLLSLGIVAYPCLSVLAMIALVMYYFVLVIGGIFTIGTAFLNSEYRSLFNGPIAQFLLGVNESSESVVSKMLDVIPIVGIITIALIVVSMVCLFIDMKWEKAKSRLIVLGVFLVVLIALVIFAEFGVLTLIGGGMIQ